MGTHTSQQGGWPVWNRHSNHSCSKKGGETFVVVSPRNTKTHKQLGNFQKKADMTKCLGPLCHKLPVERENCLQRLCLKELKIKRTVGVRQEKA